MATRVDHETGVVEAFCRWLGDEWDCTLPCHRTANAPDVVAVRGNERLIVEAKGRSRTDVGTALDIAFGQLLRRMTDPSAEVRYAIVVPDHAIEKARRVSDRVFRQLGIELYAVDPEDRVTRVL